MKLFGGSKKPEDKAAAQPAEADDFDSPVEQISLNAPQQQQGTQRATAPQHQEEDVRPSFGIESAIALMRTLPVDQNVELVVTVIKTTLESLRVKVSDIIADASRKQKDIETRVANLKQQISDFEKEIQTRKEEIAKMEADHAETTTVKGRLELAEKAGQKSSSGAPKAMASGVLGQAGGKH